jgi:hypothetical protein
MTQRKPCTFNLKLDHEESINWGLGIVDVYYRCVPDDLTHRQCNSEIRVTEEIGFSRYFFKYDHVVGSNLTWPPTFPFKARPNL